MSVDLKALRKQAEAALAQGDGEGALRICEEAVAALAPTENQSYWWEVRARAFFSLKRWKEVADARAEQLKWLSKKDPVDAQHVLRARYSLLWALLNNGQYDEVVTETSRVIDKQHVGGLALANWIELRANAYNGLKRYADAVPDREKVLALKKDLAPDDRDSYSRSNSAYVWSLYCAGDYEGSLAAAQATHAERVERLGASNPDTLSALHLSIYNLYALRRHTEALPLAKQLLEQRQANSALQNEIDDAKRWLGMIENAATSQKPSNAGEKNDLGHENNKEGWEAGKELAINLFSKGQCSEADQALKVTLEDMKVWLSKRNPDDPKYADFYAWFFQHRSDLLRLRCNIHTHRSRDPSYRGIWAESNLVDAEQFMERSWRLKEQPLMVKSIQASSLLLTKAVFNLWQCAGFRNRMNSDTAGEDWLEKAAGTFVQIAVVQQDVPEQMRSPELLLDAQRAHAALSGDWKRVALLEKQLAGKASELQKWHSMIGYAHAPEGPLIPKKGLFGYRKG